MRKRLSFHCIKYIKEEQTPTSYMLHQKKGTSKGGIRQCIHLHRTPYSRYRS